MLPRFNVCEIAIYPVCNGKDKLGKLCGKKVVPTPGVKLVKCHACSFSMLSSKCKCDLNVEVRLENCDSDATLTIFTNTLEDFLGYDPISAFKDSSQELEQLLLTTKHVDFQYNKKKVVTKMKTHASEQ